ncbi:RecX family transcriptional regulator [Ilyomonas limi]|uniref:Regulatory protein RecX n=1 Tax=Ilyomonas limi TaxID=2575867 RepID=A0A4U3L460_9BACT|nr:regulatory protein RecX [Ilyomonas limi]TKK69908.1 RecX family transcriptional regulator [Ilyomonas limi]
MQQRLTKEQAWQKIKHYCAYQERSHYEAKQKLYSFGLYKNEVEDLLSKLIEEDYLNEERFAEQFAGGKFRMKHWGKIKITHELKQKQVSAYNIRRALQAIADADYVTTLYKLAETKWKQLQGEQYIVRQVKATNYLMQKGFEPALIQKAIQQLKSKDAV